MLYNTLNAFDREKSKVHFDKLIRKNATFELTEKQKPKEEDIRTGQQNKTIHMWFSVMADFFGYTSKEECKRDVKRAVLGQVPYDNPLTGKMELKDYETHLMSISELSSFMDKFKIWAQSEHGCYLPYYGDAGYNEMVQMYKNR